MNSRERKYLSNKKWHKTFSKVLRMTASKFKVSKSKAGIIFFDSEGKYTGHVSSEPKTSDGMP